MQFFLWSFSVLVEKIITSVDDGGGSRRGEGMYAVPQRSHCGPEPWILIKNLREEEEKIHPLVQLIIFYDKLAEKHLWKVDFLQIFQRLKEVFESNLQAVEFFSNWKFSRLCIYQGFEFLAILPVLQIRLKCFIFTNPVQESVKIPEKVGNSNPLCKVSKIFVSEKTWTVSSPECALLCRRRHHHAGSRSRPFLAVAAQCWHSSFKDDRFGTWHFPCLKIK